MFREYIKLTASKKNILSFVKLNTFSSILELITFFIFPLLIRQYYIIGQYEAIAINISILLLFEASIVFISKGSLNVYEGKTKCNKKHLFLKALFFAFLKTAFFISFLYLFKKAIKLNSLLAFLLCFCSILFLLCSFYLPCLLVKNSFILSCKKSIHLYFSHPFFTTFVFLHSIILFLVSMILLNLYPGVSKIMYNIHLALYIMEEKKLNSIQKTSHKNIIAHLLMS